MRVISQDGTIDVSYEKGSLSISCTKHKDIECARIDYYNSSCPRGALLARYNSKTKAIKAMEMLREAYVGKIILQNIDISDEAFEMIKNWKTQVLSVASNCQEQKFDYINNTVFQFPKDEEIEVEDET